MACPGLREGRRPPRPSLRVFILLAAYNHSYIFIYVYKYIYIYIYVGLPLPPAALAVRVSCACCALAAVQHCSLLPLSAFLFFRFGFHAFLNFLIAVVFSFFPACSLFLCLVGLQNILFVAAFLLPLCLPFFSAGRATGTSGLQFVWLYR